LTGYKVKKDVDYLNGKDETQQKTQIVVIGGMDLPVG